jgi:hypothetical protein
MSEEREDSWQDFWENNWSGDHEAHCQIFFQDAEDERLDIVEGSAPSEIENEIAC